MGIALPACFYSSHVKMNGPKPLHSLKTRSLRMMGGGGIYLISGQVIILTVRVRVRLTSKVVHPLRAGSSTPMCSAPPRSRTK